MDHRSCPTPIPLCPLVGRDAERESLLELWRRSRLVTLFGQSGVGKSALARAAADRLAAGRVGAVRCLDARRAPSGAAFLRLLARTRPGPARSGPSGVDQRWDGGSGAHPREAVSESPLFVLLDDMTAEARTATRGLLQWLVQNPSVHLLVVTRRPLDLVGEHAVPLAPLPFAEVDETASPAATLFDYYARLTGQEQPPARPEAAAAICRALDGLPAALEAAAGLLGVLAQREIVRITQEEPLSLSLRGRSLRETLAATWSDLPGEAQVYLTANAGWPASFDDHAASFMAGGPVDAAVVRLLLQLGLLRATGGPDETRYRIAPLIRAWIRGSGLAPLEEQQERRAHYLLGMVERSSAAGVLAGISVDELASIRWAWRWLTGRRDGPAVVRFARALSGLLIDSWGEPVEAGELLSSARGWARAVGREADSSLEARLADAEASRGDLDAAEERRRGLLETDLTSHERATTQLRLAAILSIRGQVSAAVELRLSAISTLRGLLAGAGETGVETALAWALCGLAQDRRRRGAPETAGSALEESRERFDAAGCEAGRAAVLAERAALHLDRGETLEALGCARESEALAERIGDRPALARALQLCGQIQGRDDPERGIGQVEWAIALWEEMHRPVEQAAALLDLAALAGASQDGLEREMTAARRALDLARRHRLAALEAAALLSLAAAYGRAGQPERADSYALQATDACAATDDVVLRRQCEAWSAAKVRDGDSEERAPGGRRGDRGTDDLVFHPRAVSHPESDLPVSPSPRPPVAPSPPLLIRLLGPLAVEGPAGALASTSLRPKEQRVLARLALSPGEVVPRDELLDLFWHDSPVGAAERSLRTVVSSLRGSLRLLLAGGPVKLISGRLDGYRLETEACAVDAERFARAVRAARGTSTGPPPPERALPDWRRAEELYRGDLLLAFQYEDWCLTPRERLRNDFLEVLFRLAQAALEAGCVDAACRRTARMVEIDPAEERAHRLLMRCYVFLDRPAEALRQFERCRAALWEELAARPSPATVALLEAIREGVTVTDEADSEWEPVTLAPDHLFR